MAALPGLEVALEHVETNILFTTVSGMPARELQDRLEERGVLTLATGPDQCRFVTHADVDAEDVDRALGALRSTLGG
jgi:threonine aldolase